MFTGIVEEVGRIGNIKKGTLSLSITVECSYVLEGVQIGDSIAVNGICLTVTAFNKTSFDADVMPETMQMTKLRYAVIGSAVNLERALTLEKRLGGHIVSGHIDGTGTIKNIKKSDIAYIYDIHCDDSLLRYMIDKGSIAIDGTSLTIVKVSEKSFSVSIIPQTQKDTIMMDYKLGEVVNLECDVLAKYVERLTQMPSQSGITKDYLKEHGFF